jgi:hypothetical protein
MDGNYLDRIRARQNTGSPVGAWNRSCSCCHQVKPVRGGSVEPVSRKFTCKECRDA